MVYANPKAYLAGINNEYFKVSNSVCMYVCTYAFCFNCYLYLDVIVLVLDSERCDGVHHSVSAAAVHHGQLPSRIW